MSPETILCDADGCLFPSEGPAFAASVEVTNAFLKTIGSRRRFAGEELRLLSTGKNFRTTASELAAAEGVPIDSAELEDWVAREADAVTAHLGAVLCPDPSVIAALETLAGEFKLALVTSSALKRIDASLEATELARFFPYDRRFSAEDSLARPVGKPDPAVYLHALKELGCRADACVAVEDSAPGAVAAVGAEIPIVGMLVWVPESEREARARELTLAGARVSLASWGDLQAEIAPVQPSLEFVMKAGV